MRGRFSCRAVCEFNINKNPVGFDVNAKADGVKFVWERDYALESTADSASFSRSVGVTMSVGVT